MNDREDVETWITFLGVRADGAVPVVDLQWCRAGDAALAHARSFLAQHPSCDTVEIWSDGRLRATLEGACVAAHA
jgi:hypothetical protein